MRILRRPSGLLAAAAAGALLLAACGPQTAVGFNHTPIMGHPVLTPHQMAHYVNVVYWNAGGKVGTSCGQLPYRASVSPLVLAMYFTDESNAQYIRGDIAFAQSILETGWFSFCGQVPPHANNFAGIGATGNPADVNYFSHPAIGVRAQMQRLHRYRDPANASSLARPLVAQRGWSNATQYNNWWPGVQGTKKTWQSLTGVWATSQCYDTRVMRIYNQMRNYYGLPSYPVHAVPGC